MAVVTIRIDPGGGRAAITKVIEKIVARASDHAGLLDVIGKTDMDVIRDRFDSKTDPDGKAWAPNAPLTLFLARGGSMMKRSGALVGSIRFKVTGDKLEIGPNRKYAAIQQFGGTVTAKGKALAIPIPAGTMMTAGQAAAFGVERKKGTGKVDADAAARSEGAAVLFVESVTIPARPYIGMGEKDATAIMDVLEDWFTLE